MYICIYVYMYICIYVYVYICIYVYMYIWLRLVCWCARCGPHPGWDPDTLTSQTGTKRPKQPQKKTKSGRPGVAPETLKVLRPRVRRPVKFQTWIWPAIWDGPSRQQSCASGREETLQKTERASVSARLCKADFCSRNRNFFTTRAEL